jgi:hypothetical protein
MHFGKRGGSAVNTGTYWNFETGEKVIMDRAGMLPGKSSQTFFKLPPLLMLAIAAAAAHVFLYVLPAYLVQFYGAYTEKLVTAYVIFDYIAIGVVLSGLAVAALGDIFGLKMKVPAFNWNPAEAHLAGKRIELPVRIDDDTEK